MKYLVAAAAVVFALGVVAYVYNARVQTHTNNGALSNAGLPMKTITVGENTLQVEVASTDRARTQGLSDRDSLASGSGMLFIFEQPRVARFWMKDMRFSIDMIFADEQGVIVTIHERVSPESYSERQPPELFSSEVPVRYVLEVPAGYVQSAGIAKGQKIVVE